MSKLARIHEWPRPSEFSAFDEVFKWGKSLIMSLEEDAALRLEELAPAQISNYSVMLGVGAGQNNNIDISSSEGIYNVFIGHNAGYSNSTGAKNIAIGYQTAYSTTTGSENISFGSEALYTNSTGSNNIAIGDNALYYATTAGDNIAIGYKALEDKTTGGDNVAIGTQALLNGTTCNNSIAIGTLAMGAGINTGTENVAIGVEAGEDLIGGGNNLLLGTNAGTALTSGSRNVALGYNALDACLTGNGNVAIGNLAATTFTGSETVAIGTNALEGLTTGTGNTAVGFEALHSIDTQTNNTAVGHQALKGTTSNTANSTAVGHQAGLSIDDGTGNTLFGSAAGYAITDGNDNTLLGYAAGYGLTTGSSNVFLGRSAGAQETGGANKLYIENSNSATPLIYGEFDNDLVKINGDLYIPSDSKKIFLGAAATDYTIAWDGSDAVHTITAGDFAFMGGNVGIGTASPNVRLGQKLDIACSDDYGGMSLSTWSTVNTDAVILDFKKSGSATIGTHAAVEDEEILGHIVFRGSDGVEFLDAAYIQATVDGAVTGSGTNDMPGRLTFHTTADGAGSATERVRIDSAGNVGIGTSTFGTNAVTSLGIAMGTEPASSIAGQIEMYAKDSSDGSTNATLAFRTEQAAEVIGTFTASHKLKVWINGTEYWIQLDAV